MWIAHIRTSRGNKENDALLKKIDFVFEHHSNNNGWSINLIRYHTYACHSCSNSALWLNIVLPDGNIKQKQDGWSGLGFKTIAHFLGQFWRMGAATLHIFSCRKLINPFLAIFTFRWMDAGRQMPRPGSSEPVWYQWSQQVSRSLGNGDSQFGALVGTETSFQVVASYDLP